MENIQKLIERIILGLFFSSLYLGGSFLTSYLCDYWNLWNPVYAWVAIGVITYSCLYENGDTIPITTIGMFAIIGLWIYYIFAGTIPLLWVYIVVNSIVCLNIIITYIKKEN